MTSALVALLLAANPSSGTVTLPLSEYQPAEVAPAAPLSGAVIQQRMSARVAGDAVEFTVNLVVSIVDGSKWTKLSLFKMGRGNAVLLSATQVEGALIAVQNGELVLVSKTVGTWPLELKFHMAGMEGALHSGRLVRGADLLEGELTVEADGEMDALMVPTSVWTDGDAWTVRWKTLTARKAQAVAARPPMEPVITAANAQLVSTVEGRARLTVQYALELDREQSFTLKLPESWAMTRVSMNGSPLVVPEGREVTWKVNPVRPGEKTASLELTLERDFGVFHLSGRMGVTMPGASWPTARVEASVHLPAVFEWRRLGGSLEPTESLTWSPPSMPGKALHFRQHLVAAAGPTLELAYSVDLSGRYFSLRGGR
ncbi:MAG: hypothetical protein ACO1OB_01325 [Archangium sp.]